MKKTAAAACLLLTLLAQAQMKEGRIVFERTIQLPVRMFNADPNLAGQIPKSRTDQFELLFSSSQSLWQYLPSANNDDPGTFSGGNVTIRFAGGANEVSYQNFEKGIRVDKREVADRSYIVSDSLRKLNWKLSEDSKVILGYTTHKATSERVGTRPQVTMENGQMKREMVPDTAKIVAWFTTDIPVPSGPDFQGQLPGMILEMDINNSQTAFKALEISPKVNTAKIKEPKDGKKMTAAEFAIERDKIMEEMRRNMPPGGMIRMNNTP